MNRNGVDPLMVRGFATPRSTNVGGRNPVLVVVVLAPGCQKETYNKTTLYKKNTARFFSFYIPFLKHVLVDVTIRLFPVLCGIYRMETRTESINA